jgi:hypothetical protein
MRKVMPVLVIACSVAVGALLAGCGSSSSSTTSTEASGIIGTTTDESTTDDTTTDEMTTSDETTTSASGDFADDSNCQHLMDLSNNLSAAFAGSQTDDQIQKEADALQEMADAAPDDIKDDFQVVADDFTLVAQYLNGKKPDAATIAELQSKIDINRLSEAGSNIGTWAGENCAGVTPSSP